MRIAVINYSGNVGKSTICNYLLKPRLKKSEVFSVETINSNESDNSSEFKGAQLNSLLAQISFQERNGIDNSIIDIGSSNVEGFMARLKDVQDSQEEFDYFLIPITPKPKQQSDSISTIDALSKLGIESDRIIVIFNMIDDIDEFLETFRPVFKHYTNNKNFILDEKAIIRENEFFVRNKGTGKSIEEILADDRDLRQLIRTVKDDAESMQLCYELATKRLAAGVSKGLDAVFESLFGNSVTGYDNGGYDD